MKASSIKLSFSILFLFLAGFISAQTVLNSDYYQTDFEDHTEYANWRLNTGVRGKTCANKWYIGEPGANIGKGGLYISGDNGATNKYVNTPVSVVAYRSFTLDAGYYELSFDWQAGGLSNVDGFYVCWVPENKVDTMFLASVDNSFIQTNFINNDYCLGFGVDSFGLGQRTWNSILDTIYSDGTKTNLVFTWHNSSLGPSSPGAAIDNIFIRKLGTCKVPTDLAIKQNEDDIIFTWRGDADSYDVRYVLGEDRKEQIVEGVKTKYYEIKDFSYAGISTFYVRSRCGSETSAWVSVSRFIYSDDTECINFLNLSDKNCSFGEIKSGGGVPAYNTGVVDYGYLAKESRHTIHWNQEEYDPRTVVGRLQDGLKTVPNGEFATVRLGNWDIYGETEGIEYEYTVDSTKASVLLLKYAVVLQDPDHEAANQPRITLEISYDGRPLDAYGCGEAKFTAGLNTNGAGWHRVPDPNDPNVVVWWKDWTTVGLNLADYHGKTLNIKLKTYDCAQLGHYGYAYFTLSCTDGKIKGLTCGDSPKTIFEGPEGFNYRWYLPSKPNVTCGTHRTLEIDGNDTLTYCLDVIQPTNSQCYYTLYASGVGRWPKAYAGYEHSTKNCQNTVKFINKSYIKRVNQITSDTTDTKETCDSFVWDFGDGTTSTDENPTHVYPTTGGTYVVRLSSGIANGMCVDDTTFTLVIPKVGTSRDTTYASVCAGKPYIFNDVPYFEEGVYSDTIGGDFGCDIIKTLVLTVLPKPDPTYVYDTICSHEEYIFNGEKFTKTGKYEFKFESSFGCDSIVILDLLVNESLQIDFDSLVVACEDDKNIVIPYNLATGKFSSCDVEVTSKRGSCMNHSGIAPDKDVLLVPMDSVLMPGLYDLNINFGEGGCGLDKVVLPLQIYYSNKIMVQRWDDVLAVTNEKYNGGYKFGAFQWYKNGQPIEGATSSILYVQEGLDLTAEYSVLLTRTIDGISIMSCVAQLYNLSFEENQVVVFNLDASLQIDSPKSAKMKIWSPTGILLKEIYLTEGSNSLSTAGLRGMYILDFLFEDNTREIKRVVLD